MQEERFNPPLTLRTVLDAKTPKYRDFVLYCKLCTWSGDTNSAHAHSCVCPECGQYGVRIWSNTRKS